MKIDKVKILTSDMGEVDIKDLIGKVVLYLSPKLMIGTVMSCNMTEHQISFNIMDIREYHGRITTMDDYSCASQIYANNILGIICDSKELPNFSSDEEKHNFINKIKELLKIN